MSGSNPTPESEGVRIEEAVESRLRSLDAGNYRATSRVVLETFADFLRTRRCVETLDELSVTDCRRYAQHLRARVRDDEDDLSATSAHAQGPYFTVVRSFLGWCIDEEWLDRNPARPNRVTDELPEHHGSSDQQFWEQRHREAILSFVDERARHALDGEGDVPLERAYRDRAVVAMLALTGIRGAELFRDPKDEYRNGLRWRDVDLDAGVASVLGKVRETEHVALPSTVCSYLDRYRRVQDPPTDDWPVVPTAHGPTLAAAVRDRLGERGWDETEIADALAEGTQTAISTHEVVPPALTKNGGRNLMRRLCASADVDIDGEYLKPHGGRRGLGSQLYERDAELAQETLRHRSIETTHDAYRQKQAERRRERLDDIL
ncbi:site-specific integrase [Haloarculaceae archaeon H-GB11]|nr:site-specific integrase [Haloarculaceae archaeon H-GB11]